MYLKPGCVWCEDPDDTAPVPAGNPAKIVKGCLKDLGKDTSCESRYERYLLAYYYLRKRILRDVLHRLIELLFISKVSIKNQERDAAIKKKINDESSSDSDRTLTPTAIPTANSPIILTPNKGNTRFQKKMCF